MRHRARLAGGRLVGDVADARWRDALEELAGREAPGSEELERLELGGVDVVLKRGALRGRAALRHGLRAACGLRAPRRAEFANLAWLRAHLFRAPRPLFAGTVSRGGLLRTQLLATEWVPHDRTLEALLREGSGDARGAVLERLARETARMHALGFVHRDLYPRNVLVLGTEVAFVDAWRGGPGPDLRGPAHDLACVLLYGAEWFAEDEARAFLARYLEARAAQARPVRDPAAFARVIELHRERMRERLVARPRERRGLEPPSADWRVPLDGA